MASKLAAFFWAASALVTVLADSGQQPLSFNLDNRGKGVLRRFNITSDTSTLNHINEIVKGNELDVWQVTPSHVDIYVPPDAPQLPQALQDIPHTLTYIDVPKPQPIRPLTPEVVAEWDLSTLQNTTFHSAYHPLFEVEAFMRELASLHPNLVHIHRLGHSGQGREMLGLSISRRVDEEGRNVRRPKKGKEKKNPSYGVKPAFVIIGAQHAREWIATATSLYLTHALVANASEPYSLTSLLNVFDFHIIPSPNPDGYDYTWESDRFWYKTRQKLAHSTNCLGLDMNRNWGYKWKPYVPSEMNSREQEQEPADPCSIWYPGRRPFQAPETNNIANWVFTLPRVVGFLDLRSYGQMLSSPYSYSCKRVPPDAEDQIEAGFGAARAIQEVHGASFMIGSLCSQLYRAPGNILDWMYARVKVKYSYVAHLRDTGTYGFSLPSRLIRPVGEETGNMVKYLARFIAKKMEMEM